MISSALSALISAWLEDAHARAPASLSKDGRGLMIFGDVGGAAYLYADGTVVLEPWDALPESAWRADPAFLTGVLVSAAKKRPALVELLPRRPSAAGDCPICNATGWRSIGTTPLVCSSCHGLGWRTAT